ncbi:hypothetical protein [Actinoplanes sp. NPDC049265]|uniref:hypothetical protein n=1 Tax=Actinoplanes sp. NPDC049265 TaxID=3363902 RepID=UPI003718269E
MIAGVLATLLALPIAGVPASAADNPPELVSVEVSSDRLDVSGGSADVVALVHLRDDEGLPDLIRSNSSDNHVVVLADRDGRLPEIPWIIWPEMRRVSGTPQDGVWRTDVVTVSPAWSGTYRVRQVVIWGDTMEPTVLPVQDGPTITLTGGERWYAAPVRTPIRIVTGDETYRPQARIINSVTGAPVGGARVAETSIWNDWTGHAFVTGPAPGTAADGTGLWTSPLTYQVTGELGERRQLVYARRGGRGYSQQGVGCYDVTVKMQASSSYPSGPIGAGQPLTVTGHVWPAPQIWGTGAPVWLQRDTGGGVWATVAAVEPRTNGRYTVTWTPPARGTYSLRVRVPGGGSAEPCRVQTVGTALAAGRVIVR